MIVSSRVLIAGLVSERLLINSSRPSIFLTSRLGLTTKVSLFFMSALKKSVIGFCGCFSAKESKVIVLPPMSMFILTPTTSCWTW